MTRFVLTGGTIVDGTSAPRYEADLEIVDGRIARIGRESPGRGAHRIDVSGLVVAPGFIDMHAHSDLAVISDPVHLAKVAQGVTLEVVGQDGLGYSPVTTEVMAQTRDQIAGWNGYPPLDYSWRSVADYLALIDRGAPTNVATLVPHGTARMTVIGMQRRVASSDELTAIRGIVAKGLREGAVGMSTGLTYAPGMYATDDEIEHALDAVRAVGGYYCPHHRNYGSRVVEAYGDCLAIAERAGVALHLAHCHVNYAVNDGRATEVLAAVDAALARGMDVTLDSYPYLAGATYLAALLPSWAHEGGAASTMERLRDPAARSRMLDDLETGSDGFHGMPLDWRVVTVSSTREASLSWAVGASLSELAADQGREPSEVFFDLLVADQLGTGCLVHTGNETNVRAVIAHPVHTVGTDGILVGARPHPRGWGSFPRFLGHYVRDEGLLALEEGVRHLTSTPARRLGLRDRGRLAVGAWADIAVFDPATVDSPATYSSPRSTPTGIPHVFVNGEPTLLHGARTDLLPGRGVRRPTTGDG